MRPPGSAAALLGWATLSLAAVVPASAAAADDSTRTRSPHPLVLTKDGRLLGVRTSFEGRPLHAFYGVPFARPPVGRYRFMAPVATNSWRHIRTARQFKAPCMQKLDDVHYPMHLKMLQNASEDCLYLNVWTPVVERSRYTPLVPVVVILHGGGFSFGNTGSLLYDGSALAAQGNVTVVSMNFRLGVFGFLDASNKYAPGNMGLMDQRLALVWVRRNAQAFGGHPDKVTLLGLSTGAVSAGLHMAAPQSRGLFQAAILEGGGPLCDAFVQPAWRSLERGNHLASLLGCARMGVDLRSAPGKVLTCLRSRPAQDLLWAQERVSSSSVSSFVATYGNTFLPKSPWKTKYQPVPLLIGTSSNEGSPFVGQRSFDQPPRPGNRTEVLKLVTGLLETYQIPLPPGRPAMEPYLDEGKKGSQAVQDFRRLIADVFGDAALLCPCRRFADMHAQYTRQPVFVYKFCYATTSLNVPEWMGVPHSSTFWYMSGVPLRMPERFYGLDKKLSRDIIRLVSHFATHRRSSRFLPETHFAPPTQRLIIVRRENPRVRSQCSTASKSGKPAAAATQEDGSVFHMSENSLNLCLLGASLGGMTLGWYMREPGVSSRLLLFMAFPAELYVRMLECLVLPVVTSSIVAALGSIDIVLAGHIGLIAMLYFVVATGTASAIGIGLGLALGLPSTPCWNRRRLTQIDGFLDFLRNIFPDNYVEACLYTTATVGRNFTDQDSFETVREHRSNILGLLSVSVMAGCILSVTVSESDVLLNLFVGLSNATVTVSHLASWYSPVGVFFLVATQLAQLRQLDGLLSSIRAFVLASLVGLGAYGLLLLPGLYALVTGQDPRRILRITSSPALKAFRSASRTVSVPDTIEALEEVAGLEPRIVRFVIPVGANVSMSGTALVASAAAVVLAELDGLEVGAEEILIIGMTAVLASLGAASIPNSGVLTLLMILMTLEVSKRYIGLIFIFDWMADRFRTTVNIYSDSVGSAIVQQFSRLDPIEDSLEESPVGMAPPGLRPPPEFGPETEGALSEEIDMDQDVEVVRLSEAKRLSAPSSPAERSPGRRPSVAWSDRRLVNLVYNTDCVSCLPEPPLLAPTPTTGSRRPSCSFDVTPWGGSPAEVGSGASHSGICSPDVAPPQPPASLLGDWKEDLPAEESPHSDDDSAGTASGSRSPRHRHRDTTSTTTSEGLQKSSSFSSPKGRKSRRHSKSRRHRSEHGSPEVMVTPATTPPRYATCAGSGSVSAEDPDTPPAGLV